jgi:hypothetical protein
MFEPNQVLIFGILCGLAGYGIRALQDREVTIEHLTEIPYLVVDNDPYLEYERRIANCGYPSELGEGEPSGAEIPEPSPGTGMGDTGVND